MPIYVKIEDLWVDAIFKGKHIVWNGKSTKNTILEFQHLKEWQNNKS